MLSQIILFALLKSMTPLPIIVPENVLILFIPRAIVSGHGVPKSCFSLNTIKELVH